MRMHELKVWPIYFEAFQKGIKTFEIRKNDRGFKVGDILVLREFDPRLQVYLKGISQAQITYILRAPHFGLEDDYCVMSIRKVNQS